MDAKTALRLLQEMRRLPTAEVRMSGGADCRELYRSFVMRHPRYKLIQNKKWGAALLALPDDFADYLAGKPRQAVRTNRSKATKLGFEFRQFEAAGRLDQILAVNRSAPERQGQPMEASYLDEEQVAGWIADKPQLWGVFDSADRLCAYAYVPACGELAALGRLLGTPDSLTDGTMYLLISEIVRELIEQRATGGLPRWLMYDTFFGAAPGMRYFKERLGFQPYRVRWVWGMDETSPTVTGRGRDVE